jgi:hypothetical protein
MSLHDRETERKLLEIGKRAAGAKGFGRPDNMRWSRFASLTFLFALWMFATCMLMLADLPATAEQALCALVMMLLIRHGRNHLGATANDCGLFNVLVNLPIRVKQALAHIRSRFVLRFGLPSLLFPIPLALDLHRHAAAGWTEIAASAILLTAICWATLSLAESAWMTRLKLAAMWRIAAIALIAYLAYLHYLGGGIADESAAYASSKGMLDRALWVFPPAWVFPGKAESGGHILAALWIAAGLWGWFRWPATALPAYDKPHDFVGAFGSFGYDEGGQNGEGHPLESEDDGHDVIFEPPMAMPTDGWLDRLILRAIRPEDRTIAAAMRAPDESWTRRANAALVFAPLWLLGSSLFRDSIPQGDRGDFIHLAVWFVPFAVFVITLFPFSNHLPRALTPHVLGADQVPFHCMTPVATRALLRITHRISLIRCGLFALVATPFYHLMAGRYGLESAASGVLFAIPAAAIAWIHITPLGVCSRIRSALRRKRGIFLLHYAHGVVILSLSVLAFLSGVGGILATYLLAAGENDTPALLLIPAAIIGLLLSAAFARIVFEITHNEIRHRRYDWMTNKP